MRGKKTVTIFDVLVTARSSYWVDAIPGVSYFVQQLVRLFGLMICCNMKIAIIQLGNSDQSMKYSASG
jgi:hypothetical protein